MAYLQFNGNRFGMQSRMQAGLYYIYLLDWLKIFPHNQLLVLRAEDYRWSTAEQLKSVFHFLGLGM